MDKKKVLKVKTTVKQTADKIKNSESTEKALNTVNNLADKTKSTTKDLTEKIKSSETTDKIINSEAINKAKSAVTDTTEKIKSSETYDKAKSAMNDIAEKVSNTEFGEKAKELIDSAKTKNIKANRIIKIGAVVLILIIVMVGFIPKIGMNEKEAEHQFEQYLLSIGTVNPQSIRIDCIDSYKGKPTSASSDNKFTGKVYIIDTQYTIMDEVKGDIKYNYVYGGFEKEDGTYSFTCCAGYENSQDVVTVDYSSRSEAKKELMKTLKKIVK